MSQTAQNIKTNIINKLNAMQSVNAVFGYASSNINGAYPSAEVTLARGEGEIRANVRNLYTYNFKVDFFVQFGEAGFSPEEAEDLAVTILDEARTAFDMDITLSGIVNYIMPIEWDTSYVDRENDTRLLTLTLQAKSLEVTQR